MSRWGATGIMWPSVVTRYRLHSSFQVTVHGQVKYLSNDGEADHRKLKRLIKSTLGFRSTKTVYATLKQAVRYLHRLRQRLQAHCATAVAFATGPFWVPIGNGQRLWLR